MRTTGAPALYDDGRIVCTTEALIIRGYYFPWGSKKIPYNRIRGLDEFHLGPASGQWRIWGSGTLKYWFNLDPGRTRKTRGLILDLGGFVQPVITPDDVDQVQNIIEARITASKASGQLR
jgi:hypothetical protein